MCGERLSKYICHMRLNLTHLRMHRFGQALLQDCEYCRTADDFAIHALPRPLLQYVREAAIVGLVTARGTQRGRWRLWGIWSLLAAAVLEAYWIATVSIKISPRVNPPYVRMVPCPLPWCIKIQTVV
jgi:hypothetical protein